MSFPLRPVGVLSSSAAAVLGLVVIGLVGAACDDDRVPPSPNDPGNPGVAVETEPPQPVSPEGGPPPDPKTGPEPVAEDPAQAQKRIDAWRVAVDREAHRLLDEFRARVHDPMRDEKLRRAEGTIRLEIDGARGEYSFSFDAAKKDDLQVGMATVHEDSGLQAGASKQARRFVVLAVRGAYSQVLSYTPPLQWHVVRASDGRTILVAPPFRSETGVSYRLDGGGLVEMSGATDGKSRTRTVFHWTDWKGRSLLARSVEDEGKATTGYEYAEQDGVTVLSRATLTEGMHRCAATLTWSLAERE